MKVYFISGLGADERVFRHIRLPEDHEIIHLPWIPPLPGEPLREYALRLASPINRTEPFGLVGLSLGGMMAAEIAKAYQAAITVIISSIPVSSCMPPYYRLAGQLRLHKIVPIRLVKNISWIKRFFTTESSSDKQMLRMMIRDCDPSFIRWAFSAALGWKSLEEPERLYHIHGSADGILPVRYTRPGHIIRGAGHLMILNRPGQINKILKEIFSTR